MIFALILFTNYEKKKSNCGASILAKFNNYRSYGTHKLRSVCTWDGLHSVKFFSKLNIFFLDTLILSIIFLIIKIDNFRGDLSSISAKTATLVAFTLQGEPT